jgi:hypothetical protein
VWTPYSSKLTLAKHKRRPLSPDAIFFSSRTLSLVGIRQIPANERAGDARRRRGHRANAGLAFCKPRRAARYCGAPFAGLLVLGLSDASPAVLATPVRARLFDDGARGWEKVWDITGLSVLGNF